MDDITTCPVCYEDFGAETHIPRLLPCSHTLCTDCIVELLRQNFLICPECRKRHHANDGKNAFPQNKYVLRLLESKSQKYEICSKHNRDLSLFCNQAGKMCGKAICQLGLIEKHNGHSIADMELEEKKKMDYLNQRLVAHKNALLEAKREMTTACTDSITNLKNRQEMTLLLYNDLIEDVRDSLTAAQNEVEEKIRPIDEQLAKLKRKGPIGSIMKTYGEIEETVKGIKPVFRYLACDAGALSTAECQRIRNKMVQKHIAMDSELEEIPVRFHTNSKKKNQY